MGIIEEKQNRYAQLVVDGLLALRKGDALSVNSEEKDIAFARIVCNTAVERTDVTVKLVLTLDGRPTEVIDFEPDALPCETKGYAMLRLAHPAIKTESSPAIDTGRADNATMQKLGHLADPVVLDRRIAVPWCVIPAYVEEDDLDRAIEAIGKTEDKVLITNFRKHNLEHMDIHTLKFSGTSSFTVLLDEDAPFASGVCRTPSGRTFLTGLDFSDISFNVDMRSLDGKVRGKATVLGTEQDVELEFSDGRLVTEVEGKLAELFGYDPLLPMAGSFRFNDKKFVLTLGGGNPDCLEAEDEESVPQSFNSCIYKLDIDLGRQIDIDAQDCSGRVTDLVRNGYFVSL